MFDGDISPREQLHDGADFDTDVIVSELQYVLQPDIPKRYEGEFRNFLLLFCKIPALANIKREDIPRYKLMFKEIVMYYKIGQPILARQTIAEYLTELQLTRGIDFGFTKWRATQRVEQLNRNIEEAKSQQFTRKKIFGRKNPKPSRVHSDDSEMF